MNDTNTKDYMIDVAQDTTYQNQSDDYKKSFAKWRSNPQNSFGFQFTHENTHTLMARVLFLIRQR